MKIIDLQKTSLHYRKLYEEVRPPPTSHVNVYDLQSEPTERRHAEKSFGCKKEREKVIIE
eukprot:751533-Hanusia_phi.AAC.4